MQPSWEKRSSPATNGETEAVTCPRSQSTSLADLKTEPRRPGSQPPSRSHSPPRAGNKNPGVPAPSPTGNPPCAALNESPVMSGCEPGVGEPTPFSTPALAAGLPPHLGALSNRKPGDQNTRPDHGAAVSAGQPAVPIKDLSVPARHTHGALPDRVWVPLLGHGH